MASQKISIEAGSNQTLRQLTILLDGKPLAVFTARPYQLWWVLDPGKHTLTAVGEAENGEELRSQVIYFEVEPP
jgi:hypothetical protein